MNYILILKFDTKCVLKWLLISINVMSRSREYENVTATYIRRSKIPSHSTGKNQSKKVRGALYIPTYVYNYKVIIRCDTILQEYFITDRRKCENTKRNIIMNSTKEAHELQKEYSRDKQRAWKKNALDGLPRIHTSAAHLWSATERIHKLQAPESGHEDPGDSEAPQWAVWWMPSGVQE